MPPLATLLARAVPWLVALVIFLAALPRFTESNTFPFYYHPDEPGKVTQIRKNKRNFHHPQLLLNSAAVAAEVTGSRRSPQATVMAGRWTSAVFAALAAALFALAVAWLVGPAAGLAAGWLVTCAPLLVEAAHIFKEDTAFTFGFAALAAALVAHDRRPTRGTIVAVGLALAAICSAKYIGILALPVGLIALHRRIAAQPLAAPWSAGRSLAIAAAVFAVAMVAINFQILLRAPDFVASLGSEIDKARVQPTGVSLKVPHAFFWHTLLREVPPLVLAFAVLGLLSPALERRWPRPAEWAFVAGPALYWLATSFSGKVAPRYFVPVAAIVAVLAAVGLGRLAAFLARRLPRPELARSAEWALIIAGTVLLAGTFAPALEAQRTDFRTDTRRQLAEFIAATLPASAVIAQDKQARLPNPGRPDERWPDFTLPQSVLPPSKLGPAADLGTLDELRARGVTHVVAAESDWATYFAKRGATTGWADPGTAARVRFYEQLLAEGRRQWEAKAGKTAYVRQGLILFDIQPAR